MRRSSPAPRAATSRTIRPGALASSDGAAPPVRGSEEAARWLCTAAAVRERCQAMLALAEAGSLEHFAARSERLGAAADYVVNVTRAAYPDLDIPFHSRWRHFGVGGRDRWPDLAKDLADDRDERARVRFDLAMTSVLLDAGAGDAWHYDEPGTGDTYRRSEGLAVASVHAFAAGLFADHKSAPLRADAGALQAFGETELAAAFQAGPANPLRGLAGRASLLRGLGAALRSHPDLFGETPRVGNLYDALRAQAVDGAIGAPRILRAVLVGLGSIWPGRINLGGRNLGDVWRHEAIRSDDPTDGLVPFHKLSQWLTYSLIEPLQEAGLRVTDIDGLTGLAEYRNGGLFVDLGVIEPKHDGVTRDEHAPGSEIVVEWRALTVGLLDDLAREVRRRLRLSAADLPLAKVLQGGTWAAGRSIAAERRAGGGPPIRVASDGTVF